MAHVCGSQASFISLALLPICPAAWRLLHSMVETAWEESERKATGPTVLAGLCADRRDGIVQAPRR